MSPTKVEVILGPEGLTLAMTQVYTGLFALAREGRISVRTTRDPRRSTFPGSVRPEERSGLEVHVGGDTRIWYDLRDFGAISNAILPHVDLYFKRSYDASAVPPGAKAKVFPLGLNYPIHPSRIRFDTLKYHWHRSDATRDRVRNLLSALASGPWVPEGRRTFELSERTLHSPADLELPPRVLFQARLWDPTGTVELDPEHVQGLNEFRIACVRALRKELGDRFTGGIQPDELSRTMCPDCLLTDERAGWKKPYLRTVRAHAIAVATRGLHDSNGWKVAEYVSLARAILSEPLVYEVPGEFSHPTNYLSFHTVDELVDGAVRLMENHDLRQAMMRANHRYYEAFLRPSALVGRTLDRARSR